MTNFQSGSFSYAVAAIVLMLVSLAYADFRTEKVKNSLVVLFWILLMSFGFLGRLTTLQNSITNLLMATVAALTLFKVKAIGAGDLKIWMAFAFVMPFEKMLILLVISMVLFSVVHLKHIGRVLKGLLIAQDLNILDTAKKYQVCKKPFLWSMACALLILIMGGYVA